MRTVLVMASGLATVFLLLAADPSKAETDRRDAAEHVDPPELPRVVTVIVGDADGWLLAGAVPGPGDFLRPSPIGPSFPGPQPTGLYFLNLASHDAYVSVCPAWRVPDCGTSAPDAVRPLTGTGRLQVQAYITRPGWALRCPRSAMGDATVVDEDGNSFRVTFHELILEDLFTSECRTLHSDVEIVPVH